MTTAAWILLGIAAVAAVGDWWAVARARMRLEYVCKPLATAALLGVASTLDPRYCDRRIAFAVAIALSLIGDVALMLPTDRFVLGLGAFLAAHVAFAVGFALHAGDGDEHVVGVVITAAVLVPMATRVIRALRRGDHGELIAPVVAYVAAIGVMLASAIASGNAMAITGAALFVLSDSLIAEQRFVQPRGVQPVAVMVTYHLAQLALVLSLLH